MSWVQKSLLEDVISSEESEAGNSLCVLQDGRTIGQSGLEAAPVNRSRQQGSGRLKKTADTSGRKCSASSRNADRLSYLESKYPQQMLLELREKMLSSKRYAKRTGALPEDSLRSLENCLIARLSQYGSMEYEQTWKQRTTPSGFRFWEHTALARRTSEKELTGWPSPMASDTTGDKVPPCHANRSSPSKLKQAVILSGWGTPLANQANGTPEDFLRRKREAVSRGSSMGISISDLNMQVQAWVRLAGWATPLHTDYKETGDLQKSRFRRDGKERMDTVPRQAFGATSGSFTAPTGTRGVLNAAHSRWLQGYPAIWDEKSPGWREWCEVQDVIAQDASKGTGTP